MSFNISGTLGVLRLVRDPSLCLPHSSVPTFGHLPVPLSSVFEKHATVPIARPDIRAVILDKDNCFAVPKSDHIYDEYKASLSIGTNAFSACVYVPTDFLQFSVFTRFHAHAAYYHPLIPCLIDPLRATSPGIPRPENGHRLQYCRLVFGSRRCRHEPACA